MKFANITAAAVLAATLPALTLADKCTVKNAKPAPADVTTEFVKFSTAMTSALGEASLKRRTLEKRVAAAHEGHDHGDEEDFYSFECMLP